MRKEFKTKRLLAFALAIMMLVTSIPLQVMAKDFDHENIVEEKSNYINNVNDSIPIKPVVLPEGKAAADYINNPNMPKLYTMRAGFKVPRNDEEIIGYQPYIATVGDDKYEYTDLDGNEGQKVLTEAEKDKIKKKINLPDIDGYTSPTPSFTVNYKYIKENALKGSLDGNEYKGQHPYLYEAKRGNIKIKHTFQKLENRNEYGYRDGDTDYIYTDQEGVTGTSVTIKALEGEKITGYVPEVNVLTTQVPQNSNDFEIEMRYNRAIYDVKFDSKGGTELPGMTLIYGQTIPKLNFDIEKLGSNLQGWKANKDITYTDPDGNRKTLTKDTLIKKGDFEVGGKFQDGIKNAMPAETLTFTAEWTDKPKADYVIQFWTEKPDYNDQDDKLTLRDRYDFIGSRRVDNVDTGSTPDLTDLDIHGITFPDLNDGRLEKAQNNKEEFERYYFLNEDLTKKQNASKEDPNVQKSVLSTGETVYNVYYDRRVYTLYFTAANELAFDNAGSFWPIITRDGQVIGQEGSPYKVDVRFNQSLDGIWPKDAEVSNLPPGSSDPDGDIGLIGWIINNNAGESVFRDTPPYRLSAEDFIDSQDVVGEGEFEGFGHADQIPIGENQTKARDKYEISIGSTSLDTAVVHHIDIIKDDFDGKEQIDYDMSYWKSDTNAVEYPFILPNLQGFTLKEERREAEWVLENPTDNSYRTINDLNNARNQKTPFRSDADKIKYIPKFPWGTKLFKGKNAYNYANYSRNKYKLKLNNDPKTVKNDSEYGEGNILDVPYEKPLKDLKLDTNHVPKKPDWVPEKWTFKGWALDPSGDNLVKEGNETKLHYDQVLFAKWAEPDTIWKVKFDPNGGSLRDLSTKNISDESKKLEIDGEVHTYPEKVDGENTFNFVHKMILKEPKDATNNIIEPKRDGYNFAGWEFVRYTKDENGKDTEVVDTSYKDLYKVPEMYHFGNEVVGNVHLRAIWNKQDLITVKAIHHFLSADYKETSNEEQNLYNRRVGSYTTGLGSRQGDKYLLVPQAEWDALYNANTDYKTYKDETNRDNSYNQILRVEPEKIPDPATGDLVDNPKAKNNRFEFFYRPFKERVYDVNYLDQRGKAEVEEFMKTAKAAYQKIKNDDSMAPETKSKAYKDLLAKNKEEFAKIKEKYAIVPNETVVNGKRHYDARNYRRIPGWVLNDKPQKQLFFDIYEETDTFAGINETGLDEIYFFYRDVRVVEVKDKDDPLPKGYVRVTFKADEGGSFTDSKDNTVKEFYYDVIVGLKSDNLPVPQEFVGGKNADGTEKQKEEGKYYITPDGGKKFTHWDNEKLLNKDTIINKSYDFTAYFDWSGVKVNEIVKTEAYKDDGGKWVNDFAPTIDELKKQIKWVDKDGKENALPQDATVTILDDAGNEITQEGIYEKVKELNRNDSTELVRTVKFPAKIKFADNSVQEIEIPVKIYKNVYEALTSGEMPKILKDATAADGDLADVTGNYVKVTINPTNKPGNKDSKIYYVNKNAWVNIPEIDISEDAKELGLTRWAADKEAQNENGEFDFNKRHKFTEDTIITPGFTNEVVEQTDPDKKPDVPDGYVKIIVKSTDKATTEFTKIFWVNPTKEVTIQVENPVGKTVDKTATEEAKSYTFTGWKSNESPARTWASEIKGQFNKDTTITAQYDDVKNIIPYDPDEPTTRPEGYVRVTFTADEGLKLKEQKAYYVMKNAGIRLGNAELVKPKCNEETGYEFQKWDKDNDTEIVDNDIVVTAKAKELPDSDTVDHPGYVKVTFKAGENGEIRDNGNKIEEKVYYVNPNKFVMLKSPTPVGNTGYEFAAWSSDKHTGEFSLANYINYTEKETTITANFNLKDAVVPKTKNDDSEKPAGYKTVTFVISPDTGGKIDDGETVTYYVDPNREVSLIAPRTIAGTGYMFDGWRLAPADTERFNPADKKKYVDDTTIYGSFTKLKDIIPAKNDDGTPNLQPTDYVAVLFIEGEHAKKMGGNALFYVNPKADPKKTVGELAHPTITPDTGWKHKGWDKADTTAIEDYMFVIAQYEAIDDVIERIDENTKKPDGYVTVTFKSGDHGKLDGINEKVYYVNPYKYVKLNAPGTVPATGYEFGSWKSDGKVFSLDNFIKYEHDTTIIANFNLEGDVIPKTDDSVKKPDDFVTVNFEIDPSTGGKISDGEIITYFVNPNKAVTIHPPKTVADTGYEFDKWDKDTTVPTKYTEDVTTVKGSFKKLDDIIQSKEPDGTVNDKPKGYVTVRYLKGEHGVLDGQTTFYVNPDAKITLDDIEPHITIVPMPTYYFDKWDKEDSTIIDKDIVVTAQYKQLPDIIKAGPTQTAPTGYVVIIFETDGRGTIKGNPKYEDNPVDEQEIVYFVNPKKGIKLAELKDDVEPSDTQLAVPTPTPSENNKFEQWRMAIDTKKPITRGRVHIAMFKPKQVTLTYDKNGATTGTVPPALTVDYKTSVRLAGKGALVKKDASFKGWKIGDNIYQAGDEITLTKDTTAIAQWTDDKNIIEYDPVNNPTTRPEGYVRVTFAAEKGLNLTEQKAYYVKKNAGIKLGNAELFKPGFTEDTGYEFDKWNKEDSLVITEDITVTAKATKLDTVIPEKDDEGNTKTKPEGYKEVVFKVKDEDQSKGSLDGVTKFYVNPNEYVTINPPTTNANTGYEFGAWDKDATIPTVYKDEVTTITASFNQIKDVIPKTNPDGTENKKPDGYKTVTFEIDPATGGQIVDKEVTVYYVNPAKDVTINPPQTIADTGYKFDKWDQDTTTAKKYAEDTTVKGTFSKLEDIIPTTDDNPKPDGYVTVTFDKGEHGKDITGQTVYYVNPTAGKTIADIKKPTVSPETGWKANGWDKADNEPITKDLTVTAQYTPIDDVIPKTKDDELDKPEGYITVTFVRGKYGKELTGQAVYYVNPNKAVVLEEKAPTAVPNKGYTFARWDTSIDKDIQYKDGDKITALYNEPGDISETEVEGYVKVEFNKGQHGSLSGTTDYWIKPGVEVNIPAPTVKPNVGYKFDKWNKDLTVTLNANDPTYVITAQYEDLGNIIPQERPDGSDKPDGYVTVTFNAMNGSLEGTTTYYVKPDVEVDLTDTANAITKKADVGYTAEGGTWDKPLTATFTQDAEYTFNFAKLGDVIPKTTDDESEKPEGYVTVKFIPTANAQDPTEKVYYVNPKENVTLPVADPVGKEVTDASGNKYTFNFKLWTVTRGTVATWNKGTQVSGVFIQDTAITAKYNVEYKQLINGPVPKDDVVTGKGDVPAPEDLIKNIPGSVEKDSLPEGTTFTYTNDGTPDVSKPGETTAKVEVKYPDGKTTVVEVPITVVDNVVPQIGNDKPLVPDNYVKVTVDTTVAATDNTYFVKTFWVKPSTVVWIPVNIPTGKVEAIDGVMKTNNFINWVSDDNGKTYTTNITDEFTREETNIVAKYEFNKNIEPQPNNDQWIPKGSDPKAKDFIKNPYDDNDPKNMDNLPPGTSFEFVPGAEPDTNKPGVNKTTEIKVTYPNGEVKIVEVNYNVTEDVVEQIGDEKPVVPDKFVEVVVDTTDLATRETYSFKTYWVNPDRMVKIPTEKPKGIKDDKDNRVWLFDYWQADSKTGEGTRYRDVIEDRFTEDTYIKAFYYKADIPEPGSDYVVTDVNVFPDVDEYRSRITPPDGKDIDYVTILKQPDVSKAGNRTQAEIEVVYTDGTRSTVWVPVYVQRPGETNTRIVYRDRIVEKEKIVEKIVKIKDNQRLKEVRFMQGFEGKFRPHDGLTRAEAAQILANALKQDGYNYNPVYPINYKDVKQKWYTEAIVITTQANVFKGYDDGYFRPEEKISRAEWIATLKRFQQLQDADGNRMGLKENHWATREVEAAYEEGWLQIYTNGNAKFDANEPITREEVAAVSNRAFGRLVDKTYILRNDKSVINYKDINPSMWSYADILCASNSFIRDENYYMSHGIEYINSIVNSIDGNIIFNVELKNFEIIQDKFQRYLR
ncbi:MAG: InlB B-repeat-containing protein [Ezakiella sp.]|uniref:InlB B-repeat-containing protein n=1 Tax=Ezakiella sp. TaxID=1935205 RepID=UPI002A909611|nr:InlB B-repeat-containing protein [Ezakiella sp.]MDY6079690.1 InlB B-repeat-containing protein [Ezakiella sp.]